MQKFDTPAPISAVLDIPAGRIQFIAADRADTTVEVLPADASKSRDVKAAEQTTVEYADGVLRIDGPAGEEPDPRPLRIRRGDRPAARRLPRRGEGGQRRVPGRRTARRRRLRGRARLGQDRRGRERPPHRRSTATSRSAAWAAPRRSAPARATSASPRPCAARSCCAPSPATSRSAPPRRLRLPGRRHRLRPDPQRAQEHRRRRRTSHPRHHRPRRHHRPQPLSRRSTAS